MWPMRVSDAGREYRDSTPLATQVVAEDGAFAFTGLEAGRYLVTAESEGRNGAVVVALAADEARSVRLDLASGTTLAVRVVRGGAPVADAVVTAVSQPYANVARVARSGDDGGAELAGLTRGDYSVEAVWAGARDQNGDDLPALFTTARVHLDPTTGAPPVVLHLD